MRLVTKDGRYTAEVIRLSDTANPTRYTDATGDGEWILVRGSTGFTVGHYRKPEELEQLAPLTEWVECG